jgi:SAM-dependent methyltransferase
MVMSHTPTPRRPLPAPSVVWHDLECGAYRADLPLWLRLAAEANRPGVTARVLDIGSGTGRVALELASAGHPVTAVDLEPLLVEALIERAAGLPVTALRADARTMTLEERDHDLGLLPMQTLQLLRGAPERLSLLEHARAHLRPGALFALAIVTDVESFDSRNGGLGPTPEHVRIGGQLYLSRAIRVEVGEQFIQIERERLIEPRDGEAADEPERDLIELERLTSEQLQEEARAAGWRTEPTVRIDETEDHAGSEVVMLRV